MLATFGIFLLVGSDSAVKVRGGCQEAGHRDWIQCFRGEIHGGISFKRFMGVDFGYPVVGTYHAPIDPRSESNPTIREYLMERYPAVPTDVHVLFRKDEASPAAPALLQTHAAAGTKFDHVKLEKYEREFEDPREDLRPPGPGLRRRQPSPPEEHRSFVRRYKFFGVTIAGAGQDRDVFEMRFNFEGMTESSAVLPK